MTLSKSIFTSLFKAILAILFLWVFLYCGTNLLSLTTYKISSSKIPPSFNDYKIVQLSDLHSKSFGPHQHYLVNFITQLHPNLIVITGDLIDGKTKLQTPCLQLMKQLPSIAPTYYIYGNHESPIFYDEFESGFFDNIKSYGVTILYDQTVSLTSTSGEHINLIGITDPCTIKPDTELIYAIEDSQRIHDALNEACYTAQDLNRFNILLAHRPEFFSIYADYPIDLVLCGHVHGGQIRIPFIGGLYSSGQGYFPKYDAGKYQEKNTTMLINRGLGTGSFPIRIFNLPEISLITLNHIN